VHVDDNAIFTRGSIHVKYNQQLILYPIAIWTKNRISIHIINGLWRNLKSLLLTPNKLIEDDKNDYTETYGIIYS